MANEHGLATIFPPVPKTVWPAGDPEIERLLGFLEGDSLYINGRAGLATRGPRIPLNSGLYGVEFRLSLDRRDLPANQLIAQAQVTAAGGAVVLAEGLITAGQLASHFGGMYQGVRLDVVVEQPATDVEFRVLSTSASLVQVRGVKLVPRPGRAWFPRDLDCDQGLWQFNPDRSATSIRPAAIRTPAFNLPAGDHRLGVKLRPPAGISWGPIAAIQVTGTPITGREDAVSEVIAADPSVTAELMLANHGIPDAKLRFRLAGAYRNVALEVKALAPGLIVQWIRLATADEAVWHHYYNLGGNSSILGEPIGRFVADVSTPHGTQGSYRRFQGGVIYWTVEHGPCEVAGGIARRYEALGGFQGDLGFPAGRPTLTDGEIIQQFEGGLLRAES